jgi:hypothetical protein
MTSPSCADSAGVSKVLWLAGWLAFAACAGAAPRCVNAPPMAMSRPSATPNPKSFMERILAQIKELAHPV